jgi:hypothetical protein
VLGEQIGRPAQDRLSFLERGAGPLPSGLGGLLGAAAEQVGVRRAELTQHVAGGRLGRLHGPAGGDPPTVEDLAAPVVLIVQKSHVYLLSFGRRGRHGRHGRWP